MTVVDHGRPGTGDTAPQSVRPSFSSTRHQRGRSGTLRLVRNGQHMRPFETPALYPVVNLVTGSTPNGGGIWGYVNDDLLDATRADQQLPLMTEALHFQNYHVHPNVLGWWRERPLREHYERRDDAARERGSRSDALNRRKPVEFGAPLFVDSGGYRLLRSSHLLIEKYNLLVPGHEAESILSLQADYGAEIVASLDNPLPPGLSADEARFRIQDSTDKALSALTLLQSPPSGRLREGFDPLFYVACHGHDEVTIEEHVRTTFRRLAEEGLSTERLGVAIGSLVPLRSSRKLGQLARLVRSALRGIPEELRPRIPTHVFGASGDLIPLLVYLGVDSFDSSTYVRQSYTMTYFAPDEQRYVRLLEQEGWTDLPCDCRHCAAVDWSELHATLGERADQAYRPQESGRYKSEFYAAVALHNLEMELRLLEKTRQALRADAMDELLVEHARTFPRFQRPVVEFADENEHLKTRLSRVVYEAGWARELRRTPEQLALPTVVPDGVSAPMRVQVVYSSEDFRIPSIYRPPDGKDVLLVIPCSQTKPYGASRSHRMIRRRLALDLGEACAERVHKLTLSGLYGPVPEEHEHEEAVRGYDFLLSSQDTSAIDAATRRLRQYLERFGTHYRVMVGYATAKAYRTVLDNAAKQVGGSFVVYPSRDPARRKWSQIATELYRPDNLDELTRAVKAHVVGDATTRGSASDSSAEAATREPA